MGTSSSPNAMIDEVITAPRCPVPVEGCFGRTQAGDFIVVFAPRGAGALRCSLGGSATRPALLRLGDRANGFLRGGSSQGLDARLTAHRYGEVLSLGPLRSPRAALKLTSPAKPPGLLLFVFPVDPTSASRLIEGPMSNVSRRSPADGCVRASPREGRGKWRRQGRNINDFGWLGD